MNKKAKNLSKVLAITMLVTSMSTGMAFAGYEPAPTKITKLNATSKTVTVGNEFELKAYAEPYDFEDDYLVWSTSNSSVVAFEDRDRTGDDMDFVAKKAGTATVTVTIKGTDISKSCKVTVKAKSTKGRIVVDDTYMDVDKGEWERIGAKLVGGKYKTRGLKYKIVSGKKYIKIKNGKVYGKKVGKAKIKITSKADKKITKIVYVKVERD